MKLLYIVPKIKNAGGVARVLAIKANYFVENFGYEVHILSQNESDMKPFYTFDSKIVFHNMNLSGNTFSFFMKFRKAVNLKIKGINPDVILIADNGLKSFAYPFIIFDKTPIVFECHGSKYVEEKAQNNKFILKLKYQFKNFAAGKFAKMVVLSNESLKEWNVKDAIVIPNPSWIETKNPASLEPQKALVIARNSYEKGLDRLLLIWKEIAQKYPDWCLDIYSDDIDSLEKKARDLEIISSINYFNFTQNIQDKYPEAAVYLMTSRFEGFPMVLLEAMAFGLPCIAYDCPTGPRSIIENDKNGFLIPDGNVELFVKKLSFLMENEVERARLGENAIEITKHFSVDKIMGQWKLFLEGL
ncbi:MAG: glycosyltransferase family 4 protein [Flavobacterium sp.]